MADLPCPGCGAPVPTGMAQCPACGYAGHIGRVRNGLLGRSARARQALGAVVVGGVLLVRCGVQVVSHADDVATVTDLAGDLGDSFGGDEPPAWSVPEAEVATGVYSAADGSFTVVFPEVAPITDDVIEEPDGTTTLTLHQGEWHVRKVTLPPGSDPGPEAALPLLAADLTSGLGGTIVSEVPSSVLGHPAEHVQFTFADREADAVVLGSEGAYYELWHTPAGGEAADVTPLVDGFLV